MYKCIHTYNNTYTTYWYTNAIVSPLHTTYPHHRGGGRIYLSARLLYFAIAYYILFPLPHNIPPPQGGRENFTYYILFPLPHNIPPRGGVPWPLGGGWRGWRIYIHIYIYKYYISLLFSTLWIGLDFLTLTSMFVSNGFKQTDHQPVYIHSVTSDLVVPSIEASNVLAPWFNVLCAGTLKSQIKDDQSKIQPSKCAHEQISKSCTADMSFIFEIQFNILYNIFFLLPSNIRVIFIFILHLMYLTYESLGFHPNGTISIRWHLQEDGTIRIVEASTGKVLLGHRVQKGVPWDFGIPNGCPGWREAVWINLDEIGILFG